MFSPTACCISTSDSFLTSGAELLGGKFRACEGQEFIVSLPLPVTSKLFPSQLFWYKSLNPALTHRESERWTGVELTLV